MAEVTKVWVLVSFLAAWCGIGACVHLRFCREIDAIRRRYGLPSVWNDPLTWAMLAVAIFIGPFGLLP